ncbi:hypothetical protein D9757_011327 [Collybiopsis confluens]|uniref:Non-specific serine/threonine protein kinase n=1 Tax=Collybiopsis confluens TaxID=2823264 RepID=A0A8H5GGE9_9AGAR|nr:hypothetical protein D9757_011327 [Collybiopsis confluens]
MSYFTQDLLVLVLTLILAVHAAPYSAVNRRHVGMIGNAVQSNSQVQVFNTSIQSEPGRLGRRANLDPPTWLLSKFHDPKMLTDADTKVFDSELKYLELGSPMKFTASAKHNGGIWNVKSYKGYSGPPGDLLLKVIAPHNLGYGEVKALKQVGDFVASGYIKDLGPSTSDGMKSRSVIMKKKEGRTLTDLGLPASQYMPVARSVKALACNAAAEIAVTKEVLHGDLTLGNILIKMVQQKPNSVNLIDWGKGNWVSKEVKKDDVVKYCLERTRFFRYGGVRRGEIVDGGESGF